MKRAAVLGGLLVLLAFVWGGLRWKERQWQRWAATASREELQTYARSHPDQPEVLRRLGVLLREAGEPEEAEKLLHRAAEIAPEEEANWVEFSRTQTDDRAAIKSLEDFLKLKPESAATLAELSRRTLHLGDLEKARTLADSAVKLDAESPDAWRSLGEVNAAARNQPEAEKAFRKSLALRNDSETRLSLARLLIPLQRYPEVIELCTPLLQPTPSLTVSPSQRARALLYTAGGRLYTPLTPEEITGLKTQLQEADGLSAKLAPEERFLPPYFLGESFLRQNKPKEAIPSLERSVTLGPMFAGSLYALARAYRLVGETAKANETSRRHARLSRILGELEMYSNRLQQRPGDVETLMRLAGTLTEAGNTQEAAGIYRRLISQGKKTEEAQRKLQQLPGSP